MNAILLAAALTVGLDPDESLGTFADGPSFAGPDSPWASLDGEGVWRFPGPGDRDWFRRTFTSQTKRYYNFNPDPDGQSLSDNPTVTVIDMVTGLAVTPGGGRVETITPGVNCNPKEYKAEVMWAFSVDPEQLRPYTDDDEQGIDLFEAQVGIGLDRNYRYFRVGVTWGVWYDLPDDDTIYREGGESDEGSTRYYYVAVPITTFPNER